MANARSTANINEELIVALMSQERSSLWDHTTPGISDVIYYSFDPGIFAIQYTKEFKAAEVPTGLKNIVHDAVAELMRVTKFKFEYAPTLRKGNYNQLFVNLIPDNQLSRRNHGMQIIHMGITKSLLTRDGTPNSNAVLKRILLNPHLLKMYGKTGAFWVASHELGHAVGVDHPEKNIYSGGWWGNYTCKDTVMSPCYEFQDCTYQANQTKALVKECSALLPKPIYSAEDLIAIEEQRKKSVNPNYVTPYQKASLFKVAKPHLTNGIKSFISSFIKTFIQGYLKPYLIEKYGFQNKAVNAMGFTAEAILDGCLFSLPSMVIGKAIHFILNKILNALKIEDSHKILIALETAAVSVLDQKAITNLITSVPGASLGSTAAWAVIRKLPKIHEEPNVLPISMKKKK